MKDVCLVSAAADESTILAKLAELKGKALLDGARGSDPVDTRAVAQIVRKVGSLMLSHPEIREIDLNPVVAYPKGDPPLALDALVVLD
jgi:hypothetical protein